MDRDEATAAIGAQETMMFRQFGVRGRSAFARYWHDNDNDNEPGVQWPFYVIGAAVITIVLFGLFA